MSHAHKTNAQSFISLLDTTCDRLKSIEENKYMDRLDVLAEELIRMENELTQIVDAAPETEGHDR